MFRDLRSNRFRFPNIGKPETSESHPVSGAAKVEMLSDNGADKLSVTREVKRIAADMDKLVHRVEEIERNVTQTT